MKGLNADLNGAGNFENLLEDSLSNAIKGNDFVYHFAGISDLNKSTQAPRKLFCQIILEHLIVLKNLKNIELKK